MKIKQILKHNYLLGILTFLISFLIYFRTLCPTVFWGDSGELITAAYTLGIPHPSGYPTYVMLGKLFTLLIPFGSIAWRVNLMSAFFASLAVMLLYFICYKLTKSKIASFTASLVLAFSPLFWSQAVIAEVYTLQVFFVNLNILLLLHWRHNRNNKWLYCFCFTYGLSLTNHVSSILLFPGFAYLTLVKEHQKMFKVRLSKEFFDGKVIGLCLLFFIIGLLPYAYLPLRSSMDPILDYGNPENLQLFLNHLTGKRYSLQYIHHANYVENLREILLNLFSQYLFITFLIVIGYLYIRSKYKKQEANAFLLMFLFFFIFSIVYNIPDKTINLISILPIVSLFAGCGLACLINIINEIDYIKRNSIKRRRTKIILFLLGTPLLLLPTLLSYQHLNLSNDFSSDRYASHIFSLAENNSVIITNKDENSLLYYFHYVEKQREDIRIVPLTCIVDEYCVQQLEKDNNVVNTNLMTTIQYPRTKLLLDSFIKRNRPRNVYATDFFRPPNKDNESSWKLYSLKAK